jgi:hypothetical protein
MSEGRIDYETHILIGVSKSGSMRVIAHWPHVPRQAEVDSKIQTTSEPYATFILCTPTSIMPVPVAPSKDRWTR